ncbi:hypothetical protein [Arthrobacter sp. AL12]|uniref:hypothetical protein n=1 Tax=Arthrobacter sp. AL12 TaxID=3042241 RepID=UPI00249A03DC|nr:hypothetical protein [Arthrobacter sp. AL12]MDI3213153.1 hypothetical protein [Arthrobacter sp. AL12]
MSPPKNVPVEQVACEKRVAVACGDAFGAGGAGESDDRGPAIPVRAGSGGQGRRHEERRKGEDAHSGPAN